MKKFLTLVVGTAITLACGAADSTAPTLPVIPDPIATSLTLSVSANSVDSGETLAISSAVTSANGSISRGGNVTWTSSNRAIATVAPTGARTAVITGLADGTATITAQLNDISSSFRLLVRAIRPGQLDGSSAAFIYTPDSGLTFIPLPKDALGLEAAAINDLGQVTGSIWFAHTRHAFIWSKADGILDLGLPPGATSISATAISQNGQVAGDFLSESGVWRSYRWSAANGITDLGISQSRTSGISSAGDVVGGAWVRVHDSTFATLPFHWSDSKGVEFLSLSGGTHDGVATAINDAGQIAGSLVDPYDIGIAEGALLWNTDGTRIDLGACFPKQCISADALSGNGSIAGTSTNTRLPTMWTPTLGYKEILAAHGKYGGGATAINERGSIAGFLIDGSDLDGGWVDKSYSFFWRAPGTYVEILAPRGRKRIRVTGMNNKDQLTGYTQ